MADGKDYKDTLKLPSTAFPMKANLAQREPEVLAFWEKEGIYARMIEAAKGQPKSIVKSCNSSYTQQIREDSWPSDVHQMQGDKERATQAYFAVRRGTSDAGDAADGVQMADQDY